MRTRAKRRIGIAAAAGGIVAAGAAAAAGGLVGDYERVTRYWTAAEVSGDGTAAVTEVIDYSFGALASDRHGIFRWVPGISPSADIAVASPDAPDATQVTSETRVDRDGTPVPGTNIRIGDPDVTVSGHHRYRIGYVLPEVRRGGAVDWEAVGTQWEVGMDEAEVHLVTPFVLEDAACLAGPAGSRAPCDLREVEPGHVVATVDGLDAGEGVSIEGAVGDALAAPPAAPAAPTEAPDDPGAGLLPPAAAAAAGAALAAVAATTLVRRAGRERVTPGGAADAAFGGTLGVGDDNRWGATAAPVPEPAAAPAGGGGTAAAAEVRIDAAELARLATTEFAPPPGISPSHGGVVLREEVRQEHKVAWLVQAAIEGAIDIDESSIHRLDGGHLPPDQQGVLDRIFAGGPAVELGRYDRHFAAGWSRLGRQLESWRAGSGLWDPRGDTRRALARALGVAAAIAGLAAAVGGGLLASHVGGAGVALALAGGLLAGAGLAAAVNGWELHVRTPAGSALWLRLESFRRFLAGSEAYHAQEAAERGVLREYTAWALAMGEIDRWRRAVAAAAIPPDVGGVRDAYIGPVLLASTMSTATAPSSSGGGGGFGGGSVGGGAGGGGGGSW